MSIADYYAITKKSFSQKIQNIVDELLQQKKIDVGTYNDIKKYIDDGLLLKNSKYYDTLLSQYCQNDELIKKLIKKHRKKILLKKIMKERNDIIEFTKERQTMFLKLFDMIGDNNIHMFGMYGYAGTGKTTLMMELVRFLLINKLIKSVAFTAPTHKALNIMKTNFNIIIKNILKQLNISDSEGFEENLVGLRTSGYKIEFRTIHSLMGYSMDMMGDGERTFVKSKSSKISVCDYDIIIVDECSMIPVQMVHDLIEAVRTQLKKTQDYCVLPKMIFTGDPAQLPPVNEKSSSIFIKDGMATTPLTKEMFAKTVVVKQNIFSTKNALDEAYDNFIMSISEMETYTLRQVFRNKKTNIMEMCLSIRNWIDGTIKFPPMGKYVGNGVTLYKYTGGNKIATEWFKESIKTFKLDKKNKKETNTKSTSNIILTWTNQATKTYNDTLRHILLGNEVTASIGKFEAGDILILNDFYSFDTPEQIESEKTRFYTSEQFRIAAIATETMNPAILSDLEPAYAQKFTVSSILKKFRMAMSCINTIIKNRQSGYTVWKLDVIRLSNNNDYCDNTVYPLLVIHESSETQMKNDSDDIALIIRKLYKEYQSLYNIYIGNIEKYIMKHLWDYWNHNYIEKFANVIYGFSITTHKAQGSTFNNVFIDADDILSNSNVDELKRCIYTAITRCANDVHILI